MDVRAHIFPNPISSPLLVLAYMIMKLRLFGGGEFMKVKRGILLAAKRGGPFRWIHPRAQLPLEKKVLKKKERKIGREEGL